MRSVPLEILLVLLVLTFKILGQKYMQNTPAEGRQLSSVSAIIDSVERQRREPKNGMIQPKNLYESLLRASIEPTPIKNTLLEVASPLGSVLGHPRMHPLSPQRTIVCPFNPRPLVRALDAPGLQDDYYLNVLDWSSRDQLVIALDYNVHWCGLDAHLGEPGSKQVGVGFRESVTSVKWTTDGTHLIVGDRAGKVWALNCEGGRVKEMDARNIRIGCIDTNDTLAVAGGRDRQAVLYDLRMYKRVASLVGGHQQEICGLKISPDGTCVATGGNDNIACIWDLRKWEEPLVRFTEHLAAVKGMTWQTSTRLITGGGTADRTLKLWDIHTPHSLATLQTGSQVTCLHTSDVLPGVFYAAHGFSDNAVQTYRLTNQPIIGLERVKEQEAMAGHTQRVLWMAKRPGGLGEELLASASGDESIRIWKPLSYSSKRLQRRQRSFTDIISPTDPEEYNVF